MTTFSVSLRWRLPLVSRPMGGVFDSVSRYSRLRPSFSPIGMPSRLMGMPSRTFCWILKPDWTFDRLFRSSDSLSGLTMLSFFFGSSLQQKGVLNKATFAKFFEPFFDYFSFWISCSTGLGSARCVSIPFRMDLYFFIHALNTRSGLRVEEYICRMIRRYYCV